MQIEMSSIEQKVMVLCAIMSLLEVADGFWMCPQPLALRLAQLVNDVEVRQAIGDNAVTPENLEKTIDQMLSIIGM